MQGADFLIFPEREGCCSERSGPPCSERSRTRAGPASGFVPAWIERFGSGMRGRASPSPYLAGRSRTRPPRRVPPRAAVTASAPPESSPITSRLRSVTDRYTSSPTVAYLCRYASGRTPTDTVCNGLCLGFIRALCRCRRVDGWKVSARFPSLRPATRPTFVCLLSRVFAYIWKCNLKLVNSHSRAVRKLELWGHAPFLRVF